MVKFLNAATKSLQTSEGLDSVAALGDLALQLRSTGLDEIKFVTVPWEYDDDYDVLWLPSSKQLFMSTRMDESLSQELSADAIDAARPRGSQSPGAPEDPTGTPSQDAQQDADNGLCS